MKEKRKRKGKLEKLKAPELPLELWVLIADQIKDSKDLLNLTLSVPLFGLYTLNETTQQKMKNRFIKEYRVLTTYDKRKRTEYRLPNRCLHDPTNDIPAVTSYESDGITLIYKHWFKNGRPHRNGDDPAVITYHFMTKIPDIKKWYKNGEHFRAGGLPYSIEYYQTGKVKAKRWKKVNNLPIEIQYYHTGSIRAEFQFLYGRHCLQKLNVPAKIYYHLNGHKKEEWWYEKGTRHRENGPAVAYYYENGNPKKEEWLKMGQRHREDGAAITTYYENGNKKKEQWFKNKKLFRDDGPANIWYNEAGKRIKAIWYMQGTKQKEIKYFNQSII